MKIKYFLPILFFLLSNIVYAQTSYYIHITDENTKPIVDNSVKGKTTYTTNNAKFNALLNNIEIHEFEQSFPTVENEWLKNVYTLTISDSLLDRRTKRMTIEGITCVEKKGEPQLTYTPNDYSKAIDQSYLDKLNVKPAWDLVRDLPRIPIGITDTYVELAHEDLDGQITVVGGSNSIPHITDTISRFHGTVVAGILGAVTNNNIGLASIGLNSPVGASTIRSNNEVLLLAQKGYSVINCSWFNNCRYSSIADSIYTEIRDRYNTVVVFGAGNGVNHCKGNEVYPASYPAVLSVTSINHTNLRDPTPGTGNGHQANTYVDICSYGHNVPSLYSRYYTELTKNPTQKYGSTWGTSIAAPQVAAAAALVISVNPCLTAIEVMDILKNTANPDIYDLPYNQPYRGKLGTGRLDVQAAVEAAIETATIRFYGSTTFFPFGTLETHHRRSNYAITTNNNYVSVSDGAYVSFTARKEIILEPGFEVEVGGEFECIIDPLMSVDCD